MEGRFHRIDFIDLSDMEVLLFFRPFFKSLFVYRVFLRFESQLSTKGNRQIPERNERTFGKRSRELVQLGHVTG